MYERFTERARKTFQLANAEALRLGHPYIDTEHILIGLIKEGSGVAANVLKTLGLDLEKVCAEVEVFVRRGSESNDQRKLPQTQAAKRVVEFALEERRCLNHNYVGTEHILLGLVRVEDGVATQVLKKLGVNLTDLRTEVLNLLGHGPGMDDDGIDIAPEKDAPDIRPVAELLARAIQDARQRKHKQVNVGHLLLALLSESDNLAAKALINVGVELDQLRQELTRLLGDEDTAS